jgi:hypothetical protein
MLNTVDVLLTDNSVLYALGQNTILLRIMTSNYLAFARMAFRDTR